ncbi:hypothetical protein [Brevundimonas sp.]|uniref:hypothetical protein n=1 Tax=Brevundimonas sp. TaxID=1871086 RepID=UPI00261E2DC7|nr:hypothetical protein [Brevundimonas sp.]
MIELRRYVAGDALLITPRAAVAHEFDSMDEALKAGAPPGLAWTLQERGIPIGCGGLFECGKGRWLAWTWVGEISGAARRAVLDACTMGLWTAINRHGARRIESHVPVSMPVARRFNERLGFVCEGVAVAWGPDGSDYWTMAMVVKGKTDGA